MHLVIIGSSGLIGSNLVQKLILDESVTKISLIARNNQKYLSPKINEIILNPFDEKSILNAQIDDASVFICCLGTTIKKAKTKENFKKVDLDYVVAFGKLAEKKNAKSLFVVSALGSNKNSKIFYNQVKGIMEEEIQKLQIPAIQLLRPSLLIGDRQENRIGEKIAIQSFKMISGILPKKVKAMLGTDVSTIVDYIQNNLTNTKSGIITFQ